MTCMGASFKLSSFYLFFFTTPVLDNALITSYQKKKRLFVGFELFLLYHHLSNQSSCIYFKRRVFDLISELTASSSAYRVDGVHLLFKQYNFLNMCTDTHLMNLDALNFWYLLCKITSYFLFMLHYVQKKPPNLFSYPKMMNDMQGNINCISH